MASSRRRNSERFRIYISERSGFQFGFKPITSYPNAYTRETGKPVLDGGIEVAPTEFDTPPPSKIPLGGADISGDPRLDQDVFSVPIQSQDVVYYVNSSSSIQWNTKPVVYIAGSNVTQIMQVNPQVVSGQQGQIIAIECVGSSVTLRNGSGLTFDFVANQITMSSGGVITMIYSVTDSTWHITSFNPTGGF